MLERGEPMFKKTGEQDILIKDKITSKNIKTEWMIDIFSGNSNNIMTKLK